MRTQPFLDILAANYDTARAAILANQHNLHGGWEVWLQVEIGNAFIAAGLNAGLNYTCIREAFYPIAGPLRRCDFLISRNQGLEVPTYIELKCINPNANQPIRDAWTRFDDDIAKIYNIEQQNNNNNNNINCIALLATYGTFPAQVNWISDYPNFNRYARNAYIWDPTFAPNAVTTFANVIKDGNPRFFIVGVSVG